MRIAVIAFDAIAPVFDQRFREWLTLSARRRAVPAALLKEFPRGDPAARMVDATPIERALMETNDVDG